MLASALLLSAFLASVPDVGTTPPASPAAGSMDSPHPYLVKLKDGLINSFDKDAAKQRLRAVSLEGTGNGDDRALSVNALDFAVRRQGPRVLEEIVKAKMWPEEVDARVIKRVKRLPPFRKGSDEMLRLAEELSGLSIVLLGIFEEGPREHSFGSEEQRSAAGVGVATMYEALDSGHDVLDAQPPRGDESLIEAARTIILARKGLEGETKPLMDTAVGFLNEMVKLARKGASKSP